MSRVAILLSALLAFTACTSRPSLQAIMETKPEAKLIGKWEAMRGTGAPVQFEFFADGTVIKNDYIVLNKKWGQLGTGTFKFMDATRLKVELQPNWYFGVAIYEVNWQDPDHLTLRAADETTRYTRVK